MRFGGRPGLVGCEGRRHVWCGVVLVGCGVLALRVRFRAIRCVLIATLEFLGVGTHSGAVCHSVFYIRVVSLIGAIG